LHESRGDVPHAYFIKKGDNNVGYGLNQGLRDVLFEIKSIDSDYCSFRELLDKTKIDCWELTRMVLTLYDLHYIAIEHEFMHRHGIQIRCTQEIPEDTPLQVTWDGGCALEEYDRNKALADESIAREKLTLKYARRSMIATVIGIAVSIITAVLSIISIIISINK